jgi:hypothetical protein
MKGRESEPIPFSLLQFTKKSRRYLQEVALGSGRGDIVIDSWFGRDSVLQFISTVQGSGIDTTELVGSITQTGYTFLRANILAALLPFQR